MKSKGLIIAAISFFILVSTTHYWEANLGPFAMAATLLLLIYFLVLAGLLVRQLVLAIKGKFTDRHRTLIITVMSIVLVLTFLFPNGIFALEVFQKKNLLVAEREGAANCMTTLELKSNKKFVERNVCFGVTETVGDYRVKGDTVYFENVSLGR